METVTEPYFQFHAKPHVFICAYKELSLLEQQ